MNFSESTMKRDGIAITKAGKLKAEFIIHLDVKYKARDWLLPVEKSLKLAEDQGLHSIAFPTLGISKFSMLKFAIPLA